MRGGGSRRREDRWVDDSPTDVGDVRDSLASGVTDLDAQIHRPGGPRAKAGDEEMD